MRRKFIVLMSAALISCGALTSSRVWAQTNELPAASAFGRRSAISSVSFSPDGRHLVAVISPDGVRRVMAIWKADDLRSPPHTVGSDARSEIIAAQFIKNDRLFVTTQQLTDFNLSGQAERSYATRTQVLDLAGDPVRTSLKFDGLTEAQQQFVGVGGLVSGLPQDPQSILVRDPMRGDTYVLNLYTGRAERRERGSDRFSSPQADLNGDIRARQQFDFDNGAAYIAQWIKDAGGNWAEHFRWYARDRKPIEIAGFSNDPNIIFVSSVEGRDHNAIYEYDISQKKLGEVAFAHPYFNAEGVVRSRASQDFGEVLGFTYSGERNRVYWVDPQMESSFEQIRKALGVTDTSVEWRDIASGQIARINVGDGADIDIVSVSDDRTKFIIRKSGGSTPPEYYVLQNGSVTLLGRAYPELREAKLGPVELIQYTARDGLIIPGILTKPDPEIYGPGPHPAIITPHGGPWSRDNLDWDPTGWTQYFATRGYAVLQPQFRGSEGWGQRLWREGDGEWGRKMQDDNDDGARWLIEQGIAATRSHCDARLLLRRLRIDDGGGSSERTVPVRDRRRGTGHNRPVQEGNLQ